jgi:A/G-specific adenine glycosylase
LHPLADKLLDKKHPGLYNQAIMDFGAVVANRQHHSVPPVFLEKAAYAFLHNSVNELPLKERK